MEAVVKNADGGTAVLFANLGADPSNRLQRLEERDHHLQQRHRHPPGRADRNSGDQALELMPASPPNLPYAWLMFAGVV
jgi:hypothetical protein